jgi:hypothetical protein
MATILSNALVFMDKDGDAESEDEMASSFGRQMRFRRLPVNRLFKFVEPIGYQYMNGKPAVPPRTQELCRKLGAGHYEILTGPLCGQERDVDTTHARIDWLTYP